MDTISTFSRSKGRASGSRKDSAAREGGAVPCNGCDIDIRIDAQGDVNIYNCSTPNGTGTTPTPTTDPCYPPVGACLPVVPGAKHKLSRAYKLAKLADEIGVPSSLAAGAVHMMRRYLLGKTAATPLEAKAFATLGRMSRDILSCSVAACDAMPARQRNRLLAPSLILDPDQPMDEALLSAALAQELMQRVGALAYGDPHGADQDRPGRMRVYEPHGEDFFSQVRICTVNGLRTANFIPALNTGDYLPAEIQRDCAPVIVNGQAQVNCTDRTTNCPGNSLGPVCARVLDIAQGDGVTLEGVNYFSVNAKVRFTDPQTGTAVRDVDAHVFGDVDTPGTEVINSQTVIINDCRVHDQLTFSVPKDLAPQVYQIQVVVPNITGIAAFGAELLSNVEFIDVNPPATARFKIVTEWINARKETSPDWLGSDEVGLHTLAAAMDPDFNVLDLDPDKTLMEECFEDIREVDFDSGTNRHLTTAVFAHDQPILGMLLLVLGDEIDSQRFYDKEVTSQTEYFFELLGVELGLIGGALGGLKAAGVALTKLAAIWYWLAGIAALAMIGIDVLVAWWAPADPIIRDAFALSVNDLAALTSANAPAPDPRTFSSSDGIVVNVNKTIPPVKLPFEYHETREYVSSDQDSRYEITYRFNRVA